MWTRFSFERLNNDLPHFNENAELPNCVFICRLFNSAHQLSKRMSLEYLLTQKLVVMSPNARKNVQDFLNQNYV